MENVAGAVEVPLGVFGGLDSELAFTDLPQGLSPECYNVAFLPGSCFTRPSLQRQFTIGDAQLLYIKDFIKSDGSISQFALDSKGRMWLDGAQIGQTAAGNRVKAANAYGKLYLAISDGTHGQDVPLQIDSDGNVDRISQDGPGGAPTITNYSLPAQSINTLTRQNGIVTAALGGPHGMQVGYRFSVSGVSDYSLAITSVTINNAVAPGVATVTTPTAHGFIPGQTITLLNIPRVAAGTSVNNWLASSGGTVLLLGTSTPHGLRVNDTVTESTNGGYERTHVVNTVQDANTIIVLTTDADGHGTNGTLTTPWPADSGQTYTIQEVPSLTTFTIQQDGPSETWSGGTVQFPWNDSFYVATTPDAQTLTYAQSGPDASTNGGTVTPMGQISPGLHSCWVVFLTRQGYLTRPGPPVKFNASGNQYIQVSNVPLGPSNVVARYLLFTGADGAEAYYLPVPPSLNGQVVGTSSVINDNTSTSAVFDFSDEALLSSTWAAKPGANLFRQEVLESACGVFFYADRLFAWGERNRTQQFLNMGFEGGYYAGTPNVPLGWTLAAPGTLGPSGDYGVAWTFGTAGVAGAISQPAYQDQFGVAILQPNTRYRICAYVNGSLTWDLFSPSQGVLATATVSGNGFAEAQMNVNTPAVIPTDTVIRLSGGVGTMIDELSLIYAQNPYRRSSRVSYIENPEAFDGVTGIIGPATDPHAVLSLFQRKEVLHILTEGPQGSLYETQDSASSEPANWSISQVATQCGAISVWGDAAFEDWQVWASDTGLRIYSGGDVEKMSQEIQTLWNAIKPAANQFTCLANDPYTRRLYILAPTGAATVPQTCYVLDYREMNTALALANSGPYAIANSGKVYTSDLRRKWTTWTVQAHFAGLVHVNGVAAMCFCGGTGSALAQSGNGAVYTLAEGAVSGVDADYGVFDTRYTTYCFVAEDEAQQFRLSIHRKQANYLTMNIAGIGFVTVTPLINAIDNPWRPSLPRPLLPSRKFDVEIPQNCIGERIAFRIDATAYPEPLTKAQLPALVNGYQPKGFNISSFVLALTNAAYSPIRGSAQ